MYFSFITPPGVVVLLPLDRKVYHTDFVSSERHKFGKMVLLVHVSGQPIGFLRYQYFHCFTFIKIPNNLMYTLRITCISFLPVMTRNTAPAI